MYRNPAKYFDDNFDNLLADFRRDVILSDPINTANSIGGAINNITFSEKEIINELVPSGDITKISCKFGEVKSQDYIEKKPLSNRGRKKSVRKNESYRRPIGAYRSFQSQLTFVIRRGQLKEYKFLLFVNGNFTLTGVPSNIDSVMCDLINELLDFLRPRFPDISLGYYRITMRNYKFQIQGHKTSVDDVKLDKYVSHLYSDCILVSLSEVVKFMLYPPFDCDNSPHIYGKWLVDTTITNIDNNTILKHFKSLKYDKSVPQIRIKLDVLYGLINGFKYEIFFELFKYYDMITRDHVDVYMILEMMLSTYIDKQYRELYYNMSNIIRQYSYDTEKFQGFTIKILTPITNKPNKISTINIFRSGKVNLQGSPNDNYCRFVWLLLNDILADDSNGLIYNIDDILENMTDEEKLYDK